MVKPCFIGFDAGTMGVKVALYDIDGSCLAEAYSENQFSYPHPLWVEMDPIMFFEHVVNGISRCLQEAGVPGKAVKGIAGSGIVDGSVPVDEDFNPVGPYIPYLDLRAGEEAKETVENCEPIWETESGKVGIGPDCHPMVLRWLYKNQVPYLEKTVRFCHIAPFVAGKLAGLKGRDAYVDWCHASGWFIGFNLQENNWSEAQFKLYGVPTDVLPKVVAPWEVIGGVTKEIAARTGLEEGTPVIAGAGDLMVSTLGAGVVNPGQAFDIAGTASIMTFIVKDLEKGVQNRVLITSKHISEDEYVMWGSLPAGGFCRGWYRDGIMNFKGISQVYPMMDSLAAEVQPGSDALLFAPYLASSSTPCWPEAKGAWLGLAAGHNQAHLWRSMMEAVGFEYLLWLKSLEEQELYYNQVTGVGGGARSPMWNQMKADMLNTPYSTISTQDTGALGNCLIAAYGSGHISDMAMTATAWTKSANTWTPRQEMNQYYNQVFQVRQKMIDGPLHDLYDLWSEFEAIKPPKVK